LARTTWALWNFPARWASATERAIFLHRFARTFSFATPPRKNWRKAEEGGWPISNSGQTAQNGAIFGVMTICQLQTAKQRFSAVAENAAKGIPQLVTKHGKPFVVIVSAEDWCREHEPEKGIWEVLRDCPVDLSELDLVRNKDLPRKVSL
jgi:prevent-host-death family protein